MVYNVLRAGKTCEHRQRKAATLFIVADNYAENKSNYITAFCSMLVLKRSRLSLFDLSIMSSGS